MRAGLIAFAATVALTGCVTTSGVRPTLLGRTTPIAEGVDLSFPETPGYPGAFSSVQSVTATYRDQQVAFEAVLELGRDEANIVLTAPSGPRILSLRWTKAGISEQRTVLAPSQLSGLNVLGDIFVCLWPSEAVRAALPPGVELQEGGRVRQIVREGQVLVDVDTPSRTAGSMKQVLTQNAFGYKMTVSSTFSLEPGPAP